MPASSSETRARWRKKRRREPQVNRLAKPQDDEEEEEEDDDDDLDQQQPEFEEDPQPQNPQSGLDPGPISRESEVLLNAGVRISDFPAAIRHTVNRAHPSVLAIVALERAIQAGEGKNLQNGVTLENISHGQLQALSAVPADSPALLPAGDQERAEGLSSSPPFVITPPPIMEGHGVVKQFGNNRVHAVPMHADWFSPSTINRLERQVVPHFFSGKSPEHTPEKYMECRNWIVAKYIENPEIRLSVADCQGLVAGIDISDLNRIFRFLDHWGVLNYCAAAPNRELRCDGAYLKEENGEVHVPSAALKSIDSLIQFDKPRCRLKASDIYPSLSCHDHEESDLDSRIREQLSENRCNHCSRPMPIVYYQSQKEVDIKLCLNCFCDGRYVSGHSSIDFVKIDSTKDYGDLDGESWTDQETLLLLEAVEIYNDNWNEIAEHVGTKSKAQCILHFVRLPMEDVPLDNIEVPCADLSPKLSRKDNSGRSLSNSNGDSGSHLQGPNFESRFPFSNSANPVMSLVAFLASAVGPRVAAACAHASLAALSEDTGHSNRMNLESMRNNEGSSLGDNANTSLRKEDNSVVHGQWNQNGEVGSLSAEKVKAAAKAGLAAAAMKAKLFADHEEREIQRLSANIINHQLKRLELKLKQFAEVETLLMKECEQVERARQRIAAERARLASAQFGQAAAAAAASPVNPPGTGPPNPMVHGNANNRQQVNTGSPSQPFITPGYANNQPIHPQFMPRQPMYGLGQRLPLSALHPSSSSSASASPNTMFNNAASSAQPSLSNPMLRPVPGASSGGMS